MKTLSIIIVNYNVKAYLTNLLLSIRRASKNISVDIFVIDNASIDGSIDYLEPLFPDVQFFRNRRNVGFGKAHNQVLEKLDSNYTLLINPDTLMQEDTLSTMIEYMQQNPEVGLSTCKLLNADGSFSRDCIRNIPSPWSALVRVLGLSEIFPDSKLFGSYFISKDAPQQIIDVPVISGSFMIIQTDLFVKLGGFDPQFFMYFEDTDLCLRVKNAGYRITFNPNTSIIHYRGESTKKNTINHHVVFNRALYQFYKKNYSSTYSLFFRALIFLGIIFRAILTYSKSIIESSFYPVVDLLVLNSILFASFVYRYEIKLNEIVDTFAPEHFAINVMASLFFIAIGNINSLYKKHIYSIASLFKTIVYSFAGVALVTFFLRDYAFSRLIIVIGTVVGFAFLAFLRVYRRNKYQKLVTSHAINPIKVAIVGINEKTDELIKKIRNEISWNYKIVGLITPEKTDIIIEDVPTIGTTEQLIEIVKVNRIDELFFQINSVDNQSILTWISRLPKQVITRLIPESLDFILGKTNVNYFNGVPIVDIEINYHKTSNLFIKRVLDLVISTSILFLHLPILLVFIKKTTLKELVLSQGNFEHKSISVWQGSSTYLKFLSLMISVFKGKISLVGAEIKENQNRDFPTYKYGLTGFRQIHESRVVKETEKEQYELHYIKNYTVWMDLEVILKTIFQKFNPIITVLKKL